MKKIIPGIVVTSFLILPLLVLAQPVLPATESAVYDTINEVINWAFMLLMLGAGLVIIMAAWTFLTAAGDPDKVGKARNYILYAVIAIVVGFLAKAIVVLVGNMLGQPTEFF